MEDNNTTNTTKNNNKAMTYEDVLLKLEAISIKLESYTDYPQSASNNAKRAIEYKEENGSDCGTRVGWTRARQLADKSTAPAGRRNLIINGGFEVAQRGTSFTADNVFAVLIFSKT